LCFKAFCFSTLWWLCEILGRWFCKCWHATLKAKFFDKIFAHHIVQMCCVSPGLWRGSPMEFLSFFFCILFVYQCVVHFVRRVVFDVGEGYQWIVG
jgi:hypothetical protein